MATVGAVAAGLKARLATVAGLRTSSYQPEQLNPPFAYPALNSVTYNRTMGGSNSVSTMDFTCHVVVGRWVDRVANSYLDDLLSPNGASSVKLALEGDKTLGGACSDLVVNSSANISALEQDDAEYLQISFQVTVYTQ